ncbi:MAG: SUMF1/EgtB/PvdO family nonheme iron enzyme [Bdellovibrionota bacterium]
MSARGFFSLGIFVLFAFPLRAEGPQGVAVYPFAAKGGADGATAEALSSLFSLKLQEASGVRIVAEDVIKDLARQQALEQQCGTEACQIDLAKQVHAQKLVRGELLKVGGAYYVTALVLDLSSKKTLFTDKVTGAEGELPQLAENLGERVAAFLSGKELPPRFESVLLLNGASTAPALQIVPAVADVPETTSAAAPAFWQGGMVEVPAGEFWYGCDRKKDPECGKNDLLAKPFSLKAFRIDRTEVSVADFSKCVGAGACKEPETGPPCNWRKPGRENDPVNCVSAKAAEAYCRWRGKRLPSEAEWEKAARGEDGRKFPWGDDPPSCQLANTLNCGNGTMPVGSLPAGASPYGALDMAGNIWEWTTGTGEPYVWKGGAWTNYAQHARSSFRRWDDPGPQNGGVGFRCAESLTPIQIRNSRKQ